MIELRIYRAAFAPALVAAIVGMFSLESRPAPVEQGLAADVLFDARVAAATAQELTEAHPDRRAGSDGGVASARWVGERLADQGFETSLQRFSAEGERLANVVARRPGASAREIVLAVPRDGPALDTGALVEVGRALEGRVTRKTLVLASVDGSRLGSAGARRLARDLGDPAGVEAVFVLSDFGAAESRGPLLVPWSESERRTGLKLQGTAADSVRQEFESGAGRGPGAAGQLGRLAFPVGLGDQGRLLDARFDAIRVSGSGERPADPAAAPDLDRLGSLGRAALRLVSAYDSAPAVSEQPSAFVVVAGNILPGWAIALLAGALIIPALVAAIDSFARVRRRREAVLPWLRWVLAGALPFLVALGLAEFLVLVGQAPDAPAAPVPPDRFELDGGAAVSLGLCTLAAVAAWAWLRPLVAGRGEGRPSFAGAAAPGAAVASMLVLIAATIAVWAVNPFAALLLVPALHLWLLATGLPAVPPRAVGVLLFLAGLVPTLWILVATALRLGLHPLESAWYLFVLVTGHHVGLYTTVVVALWTAGAIGIAAVVRGRRPERHPPTGERPSLGPAFAPSGRSALRR